MIDTYVYFVSYKYYYKGGDGNGHAVINLDRTIINLEDINAITDCITKSDNSIEVIEEIIILNFQLLDSYNKEERGKE